MRLVKARDVQKLTGLSADQLREWTARRNLITPDTLPHGPGSRAGYAWQTVLVLRLAVVLKNVFHVELQAQRDLLVGLSARLVKASFPALRGSVVLVGPDSTFTIVPTEEFGAPTTDAMIIRLDPHLDVLSNEFGLNEPPRQLPLFPAQAVQSHESPLAIGRRRQ